MTTLRRTAILIALLCFFSPLPRAFALTEILNIRHWVAPDNTRIVIDTSDEADTTVHKTDQKITIDFKNAQVHKTVPTEDVLNKPGIQKITVLPFPDKRIRIELWLADYVETRVFKLKAFAEKPYRVVIDIGLPEIEKKETEERKQIQKVKKDKVIVIDPGHGGDDPGAVGRKKTKEKVVVLKIAKKLEKILNSRKGYKAFLTRRGDYYPSFNKRLRIAREYGADLFLSIHADAWKGRSARGSSVYCLSTTSASSVAARLLASEQNLADIIGGAENDQGTEESDPITLHMVQTETMNISRDLGATLLGRLRKVNPLKFHRVQYAPFRILKLPEIPSVLVETAYISNPKEEALLRSPAFQTKIAEAIAFSIDDFIAKAEGQRPAVLAVKEEPPVKTPSARTAPSREPPMETEFYKVKKGDTLDKIAKKRHTTIAALLKLNRMKLSDTLHANRKLKVPVTGEEEEKEGREGREVKKGKERKKPPEVKSSASPAPAFAVYTVRKGDTLGKIARRHSTTMAALLKLNKMKLKDPLYSGRKLKVPAKPEEELEGKTPAAGRTKTAAYRVKRGDTLEKIAKKHNTTLAALLKANKMKLKDPLYVGRKIKIP
jgi:N-acetylmuramoyl-L-alanine amidase